MQELTELQKWELRFAGFDYRQIQKLLSIIPYDFDLEFDEENGRLRFYDPRDYLHTGDMMRSLTGYTRWFVFTNDRLYL